MARRYENLTDEQLAARIQKFTDADEELAAGGDVAVVQQDGRRMEFVQGSRKDVDRILNLLLDEKEMRENGGRLRGRALSMRFYKS